MFYFAGDWRLTTLGAVLGAFLVESWGLLKFATVIQSSLALPPILLAALVGVGLFLGLHLLQLLWNKDKSLPWWERTNAFSPDVLFMAIVTSMAAFALGDASQIGEQGQKLIIEGVALFHLLFNLVRYRRQLPAAMASLTKQAYAALRGVKGTGNYLSSLDPQVQSHAGYVTHLNSIFSTQA